MQSFDFKKIRIDLLIIVSFAVISLLFCYPQLQGKKLMQQDGISWQGMAHEAMAFHDSTGKEVLWTNSMFGGMPTFTMYVGANTNNITYFIQDVLQSLGIPAYFFFIAMICFFILLRVLGVNKWLSAIGSIAFAFSSYNAIIIMVGHNTKMITIAYLPAALAALFLIFRGRRWTGAALLGVMMALIFVNNHYQVIFYSMIIFFLFGTTAFIIAIRNNKLKDFFISLCFAVGAALIGIAPSVGSILTTSEYAKETMRGGASELSGHDKAKTSGGLDKEYAFQWSSSIGETFCLMIPYLYGGATYDQADMAPKTLEAVGGNAEMLPIYWGPQPSQSGPVYLGAVICFLFILGLLVVQSPHKWWILVACIIGIVLSWGKYLPGVNYFLFDHIPYLNKFRTVEMALIIPEVLFPLLGLWAVQTVMDKKENAAALWKNVKIAAGITAGLCILLGLGGSMFFNFSNAADAQMQPELVKLLKEDRASLAMTSSLKSAAYILIAAGLLWAFIKDKIKPAVLFAGLALLVVVDLIPVAHTYLQEKNYMDASDYEAIFVPRDVDRAILQDKDPYYRVLDLSREGAPYNDAMQAYFHKCVGGYHPAKMEIYQDLIERQLSKGFNREVLNMLNTKYIIIGGQSGMKGTPQAIPNQSACGNAWFVNEVKWANTADEEMDGLNAAPFGDTAAPKPNAFDPRKTAVMRSSYKSSFGSANFGKDSSASIKLTQYGLDDLSFSSNNSKDGLAVFSDIYYEKGWKAYVDGKETPIMKANYVLRAIKVPAGKHNIEFHFRPASFYKGKTLALIGSILLVGLVLAALYPVIMKKKHAA